MAPSQSGIQGGLTNSIATCTTINTYTADVTTWNDSSASRTNLYACDVVDCCKSSKDIHFCLRLSHLATPLPPSQRLKCGLGKKRFKIAHLEHTKEAYLTSPFKFMTLTFVFEAIHLLWHSLVGAWAVWPVLEQLPLEPPDDI